MSARITPRFVLLALPLLALPDLAGADDWPQWRGAGRDGVWRESGITSVLPHDGPPVRWRARIGQGYSGPVVAAGRVYVTDRRLDPEVERLVCLEEATGKLLWTHDHPVVYADMEYGNGPRASPTVHEGRVYTLGTHGHLACVDAVTGKPVWQKDLAKEYQAAPPRYGASAAPLVEGDLLIVTTVAAKGGTVMAFDRHTGMERWKALDDRPAYSAPIALTAGGARQVVVWTGDTVTSFDPVTGKPHWSVPFKATFDPAQAVATPVLHGDRLLFLGAWNRGSLMLKLDATRPAVETVWRTRTKPSTTQSTPIFVDDRSVWSIDSSGLCLVDAATGDERWVVQDPTSEKPGSGHLTPNGDRVFLFDQQGHLILARLKAERYEELGRCLLLEATAGYRPQGPITWAHPAYANRHVYARNDRELVCASLAAEAIPQVARPRTESKARPLPQFRGTRAALGLAYAPDGRTLAVATWSGAVEMVDVATGKNGAAPPRLKDWACAVAYSPDGKQLAYAGGSEFRPARNGGTTSGEIQVWDVTAGKPRGPLVGHTSKVMSVAYSPDGRTLATASADRTVRLWDTETMKERTTLKGHTDAVWSVAYARAGDRVVSGSHDRTARLWDARTGAERGRLVGHEEEVLSVAITPDGRIAATGGADWTVRLWDVASGKERAVLRGHRGAVHCLAFSADGATLASGSGDETVRLWDVATGREREVLRGHRSGVTALAWAPDGKGLASGGADDAARVWELPSGK